MQMNEKQYDVAIIGAGPAGSSAAITLAKSGAQVGLFEAKTYPHDKLCGEFLSPECELLLRDLGVSETLSIFGPTKINAVRITAPDGESWRTQLPGTAWGLSRKTLDAALAGFASQQGVEVSDATRVTNVSGSLQGGFRLETRTDAGRDQVRAAVVIAAHGKRSNIDRILDRGFINHHHPFLAIKSHFKGPSLSNRIELHAFPGGYCGLSGIEGDRQVVCMLVRQSVFRQVNHKGDRPIEGLLDWVQTQNSHLREWFSEAERTQPKWISIAQVPFVSKRAVVNEVLMAGDAAGLIAPLAGDGIAMALESGALAGRYASAYLSGDLSNSELLGGYQKIWHQKFAGRMRLSRLLQQILLHPSLATSALRLLSALPVMGHYLLLKTRGVEPDAP